ncbi:MAG: hypothetical protein HZA50_01675 [Planctomycetes bacterium]|nr:hypothetical protein [Planctomycetota bacterium]
MVGKKQQISPCSRRGHQEWFADGCFALKDGKLQPRATPLSLPTFFTASRHQQRRAAPLELAVLRVAGYYKHAVPTALGALLHLPEMAFEKLPGDLRRELVYCPADGLNAP